MNDLSHRDSTADATTSPRIEAWAATLSRGGAVTIRRSRLKSVLLALLMLVIGLIGLAMALAGDSSSALVGGLLALVGAISVVVLLRRALSSTPAAVITGEGIALGRAAAGPVPWSQITQVSAMRSAASTFVLLLVTEEERRRQSEGTGAIEVSREQPDAGSKPVLWLPNGLTVDEAELATWLERERSARGRA